MEDVSGNAFAMEGVPAVGDTLTIHAIILCARVRLRLTFFAKVVKTVSGSTVALVGVVEDGALEAIARRRGTSKQVVLAVVAAPHYRIRAYTLIRINAQITICGIGARCVIHARIRSALVYVYITFTPCPPSGALAAVG